MGNIVAIWSGSAASIPTGWLLCNGDNGTPNLVNRFIRQGTDGVIGGNATHTHTASTKSVPHTHYVNHADSHRHSEGLSVSKEICNGGYYTDYQTHDHPDLPSVDPSHSHSSGHGSNLPQYYALAYIMGKEDWWGFPIGAIEMYSGAVKDIPIGWVLCDGNNGTPNLTGKFIKGASKDADVGLTGGQISHTHVVNLASSHSHSTESGTEVHSHGRGEYGGGLYGKIYLGTVATDKWEVAHTHSTGSSGAHTHQITSANNLPPYYELSFIQRLY